MSGELSLSSCTYMCSYLQRVNYAPLGGDLEGKLMDLKVWLYFRVQYTMAPKIVRYDIKRNNAKCHYAYYTVIPLSHRFFVHVLFSLNLQGNPLTIM